MIKIEVICESCDSQYIVITKEVNSISYCPICSAVVAEDEEDEE